MRLIDADALIEDIDGDLTDSIAEGMAIEKIMNAPAIEPERKKGKWLEKKVIPMYENGIELQSCRCSECEMYDTRPYTCHFREPNYCSWCGLDMRGGEDE